MSPLNTVEKRRQLLMIVVILFAMHAFFSEWIVKREDVEDPELKAAYGQLFDSYAALWHE